MTKNVSDTLNLAADLIEEHGWGQGDKTWSGCAGVICLDEAIARALGFTGCNQPPRLGGIWPQDLNETPASRAVRAHLQLTAYDLYCWNDAEGRTATEVVEALRAAAVIESARENRPANLAAAMAAVTS